MGKMSNHIQEHLEKTGISNVKIELEGLEDDQVSSDGSLVMGSRATLTLFGTKEKIHIVIERSEASVLVYFTNAEGKDLNDLSFFLY